MAIFCCHCHFYSDDKKPVCNACGRTRASGWRFLAGVNGHTLGQCGSAMTYCNDSAEGKLQQSQLFPRTAACRPAKQSVDVKGSGVKKTQMRRRTNVKVFFKCNINL